MAGRRAVWTAVGPDGLAGGFAGWLHGWLDLWIVGCRRAGWKAVQQGMGGKGAGGKGAAGHSEAIRQVHVPGAAFFEIFGTSFRLLDLMWTACGATHVDFGEVLQHTRVRMAQFLGHPDFGRLCTTVSAMADAAAAARQSLVAAQSASPRSSIALQHKQPPRSQAPVVAPCQQARKTAHSCIPACKKQCKADHLCRAKCFKGCKTVYSRFLAGCEKATPCVRSESLNVHLKQTQ